VTPAKGHGNYFIRKHQKRQDIKEEKKREGILSDKAREQSALGIVYVLQQAKKKHQKM